MAALMLRTAVWLGVVSIATATSLSLRVVDAPGAACLDGSSPAYYIRRNTASSQWRIHFRGGAWCFTPASCASRSATDLGSSANYQPTIPNNSTDDLPEGFMSTNASANPFFADWNVVFVEYCDGSSFTSNRATPYMYKGKALHMRGYANLRAVVGDLQHTNGMADASDVIVSGTSAGGLATYIHTRTIKELLPPATNVLAMPDAGFFLDHPDLHGTYSFRSSFQGALSMWNSTEGMNPACVAAYNASEHWKCMMAQYTYPFINLPVLAVNSMADTYQLSAILKLSCGRDLRTCSSSELALAQEYRGSMLSTMKAAGVLSAPHSAAFLTACNQHEETCADEDWGGIRVGGQLLEDAAKAWFQGSPKTAIDGQWPSNPSCAPPGARHGGC